MEDIVSTWVIIEDYREIVDTIFDEELKNIYDVLAINIGIYDDYCKEECISLKDKNYTHLESME